MKRASSILAMASLFVIVFMLPSLVAGLCTFSVRRSASIVLRPTIYTNPFNIRVEQLRSKIFTIAMERKPGVSSPEDLADFVASAGGNLIVVDARNRDFSKEPGDEATNVNAPIAPDISRPRAINIVYDRASNSMDLEGIPTQWIEAGGGKEKVPVITHCGGGGRGQKAKEFLMAAGFQNVVNGGGPEDTECWKVFGNL